MSNAPRDYPFANVSSCGFALLAVLAAAVIAWTGLAGAQARASNDENALRSAIAKLASTWNEHDLDAWAALLSEQIVDIDEYGNEKRSRAAVVTSNKVMMSSFDRDVQVVRLRLDENGAQATVVLHIRHLGLPIQRGKYYQTFDREPVLSRWRLEDGVWRLFYLNENSRQAAEIVQAERLD